MDLGLRGTRVLVTGGASNIGRGIVHGFASLGARVLICDIDDVQADKVRAEALARGAEQAEVAALDLTAEGAGEVAVGQALSRWGGIDALVSNAGWCEPRFLAEDTDRARWQKTIEINLFAAFGCTQAAVAAMREAGRGSIVYISSDAAFGEIRQGVYGTTKAGLIALSRTVAKEHGRHGIRSNVVCPGLVLPESADAVGSTSLWAGGQDSIFDERQVEGLAKSVPLRRLTTAEDVANAVCWLSSEPLSRQVTGQVVAVNGGYSMP